MPTASQQPQYEQLPLAEWIDRLKSAGKLPRHIAVIMDGNGRWARKRFLPRVAGHRAGRHSVRRTVQVCSELGIEVLTLYTFSQENWKRPVAEVQALWSFLEETLLAERDELAANRVSLRASGEIESLPKPAQEALQETITALADNDGLIVNLALAYGGRTEILHAASNLAGRILAGEVDADALTEADFSAGLYSPDLPDPDLVIRTSGESRLSNFLLWQSAYAEFYVTPVLWPDFRERDLLLAVTEFQGRERRFGGIDCEAPSPDGGSGFSLDPTRWLRLLKVRS
ncbi:MAG: polyprenyl diphosphate synthase [bacterium]